MRQTGVLVRPGCQRDGSGYFHPWLRYGPLVAARSETQPPPSPSTWPLDMADVCDVSSNGVGASLFPSSCPYCDAGPSRLYTYVIRQRASLYLLSCM